MRHDLRRIGVLAHLIELNGKTIFVLNGLSSLGTEEWSEAIESLHEAVESEPEAVAFGRIEGRWVAAA